MSENDYLHLSILRLTNTCFKASKTISKDHAFLFLIPVADLPQYMAPSQIIPFRLTQFILCKIYCINIFHSGDFLVVFT